jgi:hypothetical protein
MSQASYEPQRAKRGADLRISLSVYQMAVPGTREIVIRRKQHLGTPQHALIIRISGHNRIDELGQKSIFVEDDSERILHHTSRSTIDGLSFGLSPRQHAAWLLDAGYIDGYTGKPPFQE